MQRWFTQNLALTVALVLVVGFVSSTAAAQYKATNLTSDLSGKTKYTDTLLKNPWGLAYSPSAPFWVSDEASGWSTLYNAQGQPQSLKVVVPPLTGTGAGTPTGIVYNGSQEFKIDNWVSEFLFATLDGTIQGWSNFDPSTTLIGASNAGASYTGLAITSKSSGNTLFAADAAGDKVDMYNATFQLTGSFTDSSIPKGFAPFGIQDIKGQVYVTFAATNGGAGGYIDIFSEQGTLVKRLAKPTLGIGACTFQFRHLEQHFTGQQQHSIRND